MKTYRINILIFATIFALFLTGRSGAVIKQPVNIPVAGEQYKEITPVLPAKSAGDKVLVQEFFSFYCGHCYSFNDDFLGWEKRNSESVKAVQIPVTYNKTTKALAKLFYTLKKMGLDNKTSLPVIFKAIQQEKQQLSSFAEIKAFVKKHWTVDIATFKKLYHSKEITQQIDNGYKLVLNLKLTAVPAVLIDGRYLTNPEMAKGSENMLKVINYLVKKSVKRSSSMKN